jgi:hypothetical protein
MSTRIKGTGLKLVIDGVDYYADATSVVLDNEDAAANVVTFADAAAGGSRTFFFTITAIQSTDTSSFWRALWANTGDIVEYTYAPHGNASPSSSQPHFEGTVKIPAKPSIGGAAGMDVEYTFDVRMDCQETPSLVTA